MNSRCGRAIALRTRDWTYVYRLYEDDELYDRRRDPDETVNLAATPDFDSILERLRERTLRWIVETSDVIPWDADPRVDERMLALRERWPHAAAESGE